MPPVGSGLTSVNDYCHNLFQSDLQEDKIIRDGFIKLPFYLSNLYKINWLHQKETQNKSIK